MSMMLSIIYYKSLKFFIMNEDFTKQLDDFGASLSSALDDGKITASEAVGLALSVIKLVIALVKCLSKK